MLNTAVVAEISTTIAVISFLKEDTRWTNALIGQNVLVKPSEYLKISSRMMVISSLEMAFYGDYKSIICSLAFIAI